MQVQRKPIWELNFIDLSRWGLIVVQHLEKWLELVGELKFPFLGHCKRRYKGKTSSSWQLLGKVEKTQKPLRLEQSNSGFWGSTLAYLDTCITPGHVQWCWMLSTCPLPFLHSVCYWKSSGRLTREICISGSAGSAERNWGGKMKNIKHLLGELRAFASVPGLNHKSWNILPHYHTTFFTFWVAILPISSSKTIAYITSCMPG